LRLIQGGLLFGATALIVDANIAQAHVVDCVTGYAANNRGILWIGVIDNQITNNHPSQCADGGFFFWPTCPVAKPKEERRIANVPHGDVRDRYILQQGAVNRLEREATAVVK